MFIDFTLMSFITNVIIIIILIDSVVSVDVRHQWYRSVAIMAHIWQRSQPLHVMSGTEVSQPSSMCGHWALHSWLFSSSSFFIYTMHLLAIIADAY